MTTLLIHPASTELVGTDLARDLSNQTGCPVRVRGIRVQYLALILEESRHAAKTDRLDRADRPCPPTEPGPQKAA